MTDDTVSIAAVESHPRGVRFPGFPLCPDLRPRGNPRTCCLRPDSPPKRPDPGIYSQVDSFAAAPPPSWDSPDITTNLFGQTTLDENVRVTVRNYSPDAPALNTQVQLEYSRFGIGFARNLLGIQPVDLNKAGHAQEEQTLDFYVPTAVREKIGNISVFVTVAHPKDRNPRNNTGEQAWSASASTAGSAATFDFEVHNALASSSTFDLLTLEADWSATLSDSQVVLVPGQTRNVTLNVQVPASASGSQRFNVVALLGGSLYGGIFHRFDT